MRKLLSLGLVLCFILSAFPVYSFAEETELDVFRNGVSWWMTRDQVKLRETEIADETEISEEYSTLRCSPASIGPYDNTSITYYFKEDSLFCFSYFTSWKDKATADEELQLLKKEFTDKFGAFQLPMETTVDVINAYYNATGSESSFEYEKFNDFSDSTWVADDGTVITISVLTMNFNGNESPFGFLLLCCAPKLTSTSAAAFSEDETDIAVLKQRIEELEAQLAEKDRIIETLKAEKEEQTEEAGDIIEISNFEPITLDCDDGTLVIKGYSFAPHGYQQNSSQYNGYSIFTVHATIIVKGDETQSSWQTLHTQAYQNGIEAQRHSDFSKKVRLTTDILPNTPVDIDYDFLVESDTDPVTFIVKTWGPGTLLYSDEILIDGTEATPKGQDVTGNGDNYADLSIGDTISTDYFDLTISNIEFSYEVYPENTSGHYRYYPANAGRVYIHIDGKYFNKAKRSVSLKELPVAIANYDDGYIYEGFVIVDNDDRFIYSSSSEVCVPLANCHYHCLIECPDTLETSEGSLECFIKLGDTVYRYKIR